jgi:L-amino acid N-acyltransferase
VIIRPALAEDAESIASILNALIPTTTVEWREHLHTAAEVRKWLDEHQTVLIAEVDSEVVGLAAYGWFRDIGPRPGYRFTVENTVHVREDHRKGERLMQALIAEARRAGLHTMVAAVDGENVGSVRFHKRLGFVEVARMPQVGAKFGRWCDLVLLQLRLDDRPGPSSS